MSKTTNPTTEPSVSSGFYDSNLAARDRKYYASDLNKLVSGIITDGVFMNIGECLLVTAAGGNTVSVGSGKAWFNDHWVINDAGLPIECEPAEVTLDRIDAIVVEINDTDPVRDGFIKYVKGAVDGGEAKRPILINDDVNKIHQHALCYITRPMGSSEIRNQDIDIVVGLNKETPFVTSVLETGTIEGYFASWEEQFIDWFEHIKANLDKDAAGNLQNQIDALNNTLISELYYLELYNSSLRLVNEFDTPGAYEWTPDYDFMGVAVIVGAGSSGKWGYYTSSMSLASENSPGWGGDGGAVVISPLMFFSSSKPVNIVVGEGGAVPEFKFETGNVGGSSSALGFVAEGGKLTYETNPNSYTARTAHSMWILPTYGYPDNIIGISNFDIEDFGIPSISYGCVGSLGGRQSYPDGFDACQCGTAYKLGTFSLLLSLPEKFAGAGGGRGGHIKAGNPEGKGGASYFGKGGDGGTSVNTPGGDGSRGCGGGGGYSASTGASYEKTQAYFGPPGKGGDGYVAIYEFVMK